jgi:hypothetical protein
MTAMSMKDFSGMLPRLPDHLLPDNAAASATNCDFSRNRLQPLRAGLQVLNPGGTIRGMYTGDGLYWYTWPSELVAYKSPVIGEIYNRLYYIEGGVLRVSPTPETAGAQYLNGGVPNQVWAVGVPTPSFVPTVALVDRTSLADYPSAAIEFKYWYSNGAVNYGVTTVVPSQDIPWKRYTFTAGAAPADAPDGAVLVVQATATEGSKQLFQINTASDTIAPAASAALPGGITMTLEAGANGVYHVVFSWGVVETRAYIFTEVNTWDEESGPSPVALVSPTYLQDVQVTVTHPNFASYRPYQKTNIYRTYGGSQYIKAGTTATTVFLDSARTVQSATGTALPSLSWVPPLTGMFGLVLAPNGWFAAFKDNVLYMSEPYRPHTWQYSMTFAKSIVGICVGAQSIVVTTREATYIVTGPHPASVNSMTVPTPVGGITHRSMCAVEGGVAFLSHDGIVVVEGSQVSLTEGQRYFTREVWRTMFGAQLDNMTLAYHDGCVVCTSNNTALGFVLELDEAAGAMTRYDNKFDSMMRLPVLDTLYYAAGGKIYRFREDTAYLSATWDSKQFITPGYAKIGIGFVRMSGFANAPGLAQVIIYLYADDQLLQTQTFDVFLAGRTNYFRVKPHPGALKWQVRVAIFGQCALEDVAFAHTPDELKTV